KWSHGLHSVNRRGRTVHEALHPKASRALQEHARSMNVRMFVQQRIGHARSHSGVRSQMNDGLDRMLAEEPFHGGWVAEGRLHQLELRMAQETLDVGLFAGRRIKVVEVVEADDPVGNRWEQMLDQ